MGVRMAELLRVGIEVVNILVFMAQPSMKRAATSENPNL